MAITGGTRLSDGTESPQLRTPWESFILAYAAMVPLLAGTVAAWWLGGSAGSTAVALCIVWGGAVLCFLAGVRRGLSFRQDGGPTLAQIATMLWLFVLGAAALISPWPVADLVLEFLGYATMALFDPASARRNEVPQYFARLRPIQMMLPLACIASLLLRLLS